MKMFITQSKLCLIHSILRMYVLRCIPEISTNVYYPG